jgi:citrate synthase
MLNRGLEGVVLAESAISSIIDGVLTYGGININDLAVNSSYEEVVYLLWNGRLPNQGQLARLKAELVANFELHEHIIEILKASPKNVHSMDLLRTAISLLAHYDEETNTISREANLRKSIRLVAKTSAIVAAIARIREGKEPVSPKPELGFAQNFLYMLKGEIPDVIAADAFNKALVLHADHEFNASTFSARVTVATLSDIYSGIVAAIGTLKGPLHGGANEGVMAMLEEIGSVDNVEPYLRIAFDKKQKIMGFGHRVYRNGDPRAQHLRTMSEKLTKLTGQSDFYEMSVKIENKVTGEKGLKANVDFYSATVYHSLGIPRDLFTPVFAVSRMSGWTAHIMEQYADNRLIRPRAEYVGPKHVIYVPLEKR